MLTWIKWLFDKDKMRVPPELRGQYRRIFFRTWRKLGHAPDIFDGDDFNNKIKWLMLFDQNPEMVRCADKLAVRDYVEEKIGKEHLTELYRVWDSAADIDFSGLPPKFVLKTNHDSGSVWLIKDVAKIDLRRLKKKVARRLARTYGVHKGEWCYSFIKPRVFAEEYLDTEPGGPADYKFHCANGKVVFAHYIYDRATGNPKEQIVLPSGEVTGFKINHENGLGSNFEKPILWAEMLTTAEELSAPFKYARIDLYEYEKQIKVGEITFFPMAGGFREPDQEILGSWLEIDRSTTRPAYNGAPD